MIGGEISTAYCCTRCGKCFNKSQLKAKAEKEDYILVIEYCCPICKSVIVREYVRAK